MKRIAFLAIMALATVAASASSIRYFTSSQAARTVSYLNAQQEIMIYCGYEYEIETYVLVNEVWAEKVNSAYYELWIFGYDAYTGEEIYMPLDLQCVWLYSGGRMYSAAQYLRFHTTARMPSLTWYVPSYNRYTRVMHSPNYARTYHYDVHVRGWMPPAPPAGGYGPAHQPPLPPYYMRQPQAPAPRPTAVWTPGVERPRVQVTQTREPGNTGSNTASRPSAQPNQNSRNQGAAVSGGSNTNTRQPGNTGSGSTTRPQSSSTTTRQPGNTGSSTSSGTTTRPQSSSTTTRQPGNTGSNSSSTTTTRPQSSNTTTRQPGNTGSSTTTTRPQSSNTTTRQPGNTGSNTTTTRPQSSSTTTRQPGNTGSSTSGSNTTTRPRANTSTTVARPSSGNAQTSTTTRTTNNIRQR